VPEQGWLLQKFETRHTVTTENINIMYFGH